MPAYKREVVISQRYPNGTNPDGSMLCNGCLCNLIDPEANPTGLGYLLYTSKENYNEDRPYDIYCQQCITSKYPKAKAIEDKKIVPDYGLYLLNSGYLQTTSYFFYDFRMDHLGVIGEGQYSTSAEMQSGGVWYAISLDFNTEQLTQILENAPVELALAICQDLVRDPSYPRTIDLPAEVVFGFKAKLGARTRGLYDEFVPFTAAEIFKVDQT